MYNGQSFIGGELFNMIDNSFQVRYNSLPIAVYAINEPPVTQAVPFMLTHHHSEFEVISIISGSCQVIIEETTYTAQAGDLFLIPPYSLHSGCILPGNAFSHICLCFDVSLLGEADFIKQLKTAYLDVTRHLTHADRVTQTLFPLTQQIYRQCTTRAKGWRRIVQGQLLTLMGLLEQSENIFPASHKGGNCDFGVRVLELVNERYREKLTSRDIATDMCYSQSYFCRLFRENFSTSFQEYLCKFRLCKAKMLLTQRDISVGEVAVQVGLNNISYFSKQFRSMYGHTPKQFQLLNVKNHSFDEYYLVPSSIAGCAKP